MSEFHQIFCTCLAMTIAPSSSDGSALCTSGFVDDVMFLHSGTNGPESKTTRMFRPNHQVAALGAKLAVSYCILFR